MSQTDDRGQWAQVDAELNGLRGDLDIASVIASIQAGAKTPEFSVIDRELETLGSPINGNAPAPTKRKSSQPPPLPTHRSSAPPKRPSLVPPPLPSKRASSKPPSAPLPEDDSFPRAAMFDTPPPPAILTPVPPVAASPQRVSSAPPARISSVPAPTFEMDHANAPEPAESASFERHSLLSEEDLFAGLGAAHAHDEQASSDSLVPDEDDTNQMPPPGRGEPTEPLNLFDSLEPEFAALLGVSPPHHDEEEATTQWAPSAEEVADAENRGSAPDQDFELMVDETRLSEPANDPTDNEGGALPDMAPKESATDIQLEPPVSLETEGEDTQVSKEPKKGFFKKLFG